MPSEINHLNSIFGYEFRCFRPQDIWSTNKRLTGQRSGQSTINNIGQLNREFIFQPAITAPLSVQQEDDNRPALPISPEEMVVFLKKIKPKNQSKNVSQHHV